MKRLLSLFLCLLYYHRMKPTQTLCHEKGENMKRVI